MRKNKYRVGRIFAYLFISLWCLSVMMFFYWMISSSFKTNKVVLNKVWSFPETFDLKNYAKVWSYLSFGRFTLNTIIVVVVSVFLIVVISSMAAYALTKTRMRFAEPMTFFFIAGLGIPLQLLLIPLYKMLSTTHLLDTIPGLIVVYVGVSIPFTIFLLLGFFSTIPDEIGEAAYIDGCNEFQIFSKVMIHMARPGVITAIIFNFIFLWNEYMLASIFIKNKDFRTLSLSLFYLQNSLQINADWVSVFAGSIIVMLPVTIFFIIVSERLITGITMGAIK